ncbi:MAG TPA: helix-turn-helix domain-containing protein [Leptolyngbyaceae cyanobacterium M33_DOE_097]|uniref:Helix-turn-helix domain-containing protein n=1 Tax=Oscillatoriales cyanobacterium SpSt-418 TaxID=2282169 RepID=A0A7C3KCC8_9CYAN|nr:helix-turn-helix domain-containing protein [Leptolyngbyaceae cyanobacterium M33_DOE_097]
MRSHSQLLQYQVIAPHPLLASYIGCYWILRTPTGQPARRELILPDGYAELILNYGKSYTWHNQSQQDKRVIQTVHLVGERDASILVDLEGGLNQIGVKFKPIGLFVLLRQPLHELANRMVNLDELSNKAIQELSEQVFEAVTDEAKVEVLNQFFIKCLLVAELSDSLVEKAMQLIFRHQGNLRIENLTNCLDVHYKTLERKFKTYIGLTPKVFARVIRFKHTYKQFHTIAAQDPSFFLDLGYYDQNHFIKDFKYFLHTTPSAYLRKQRSALSSQMESLSDEIVRRGLVERSQTN